MSIFFRVLNDTYEFNVHVVSNYPNFRPFKGYNLYCNLCQTMIGKNIYLYMTASGQEKTASQKGPSAKVNQFVKFNTILIMHLFALNFLVNKIKCVSKIPRQRTRKTHPSQRKNWQRGIFSNTPELTLFYFIYFILLISIF